MLNEILVNQLGFLVGFETLNETVFQGDPSILISQAGVKGIDPESMIHILEKMNYGDKNIEANQFATIQNMIVESSLKVPLGEKREQFAAYIVENPSLLPSGEYPGLGMYNNKKMIENAYIMDARKTM